MSKSFIEIAEETDHILTDYSTLISKLDFSKPGDAWIARNAAIFSEQLRRLAKVARKTNLLASFEAKAVPHPFETQRILEATGWHDGSAPVIIQKWRKNPYQHPYASIPDELRKEIFDYFFRHDVHGELEDESTILLSRGVNDPTFFRPPTIVNVALDVASKNNWFGYSDSLGHVETREAIAALERVRRNQESITINNAAVVQGGTAGLHAVLSMLCRKESRKGCVVAAPTYAPLLDDVSHHFKPYILELSEDYEADYERLVAMIETGNVSAVLISMPHNPYGFRDFDDHLDRLHQACFKNGVFLICDEIIFDEKISRVLNPINYPNLIIISSYSKTYNIPGLKLGHILARQDFLDDFYRHASTTYGSAPSFLYLTSTCISAMEKYARAGNSPNLPAHVINQFSNSDLITKDFDLWRRLGKIYFNFQNLVSATCSSRLGHTGIDATLGLDDPSYNVVVRMKGQGSAYRASMDVLAARNVSSMPIECFSPVHDWPRDLRVTIAIEPERLVVGYPQLLCGVDDIVAEETKTQWLHNDDVKWLDRIGLAGKVKGLNSWGRAKRIQTRLQEIFGLAGKVSVPENLKRTAALISLRHTWSQVSADERQVLVTELTGRNEQDSNEKLAEVMEYLINRQGCLSDLPPLPDDIKSMVVALVKHPLPNGHAKPELRVVAAAELLQGVSLLENPQETLEILDRGQDFAVLSETVEQVKTLEF
jgi:aspartate/methionine/tyrosine aminotransferase